MKKCISVLLAVLLTFSFCAFSASAAQAEKEIVGLKLKSDIGGLCESDYESFAEILTGSVTWNTRAYAGPLFVSDYAGTAYSDKLVAGRTYTVYYNFSAADGFVLPETTEGLDLRIEPEKGVRVISCNIVRRDPRSEDPADRSLAVTAVVKVDGNWFQNITGRLYDIYLKIKAWSLY